MSLALITVFLSVMAAGSTINRPVYKISLTQKGFTQFVQYDVETPPLREFTACVWIRVFDLASDQSIFTYVANGHNRAMRLWLDSGGHHLKISLNGVTSSTLADIAKDVWRHVCLSYQADFGAWALYIDSRLISCEAAQSSYGYVLPGGGSVIFGYGTSDDGLPNGLEGEIFGASMILRSTIEKNYTAKNNPLYEQKHFRKNKIKVSNRDSKYVVLTDLQPGEKHNSIRKIKSPFLNNTRNYIKFQNPQSSVEHSVGLDLSTRIPKVTAKSEVGILDFTDTDRIPTSDQHKSDFWNFVNKAGHVSKFKKPQVTSAESYGSGTYKFSTVSEFETPPPASSSKNYYFTKSLDIQKPVLSKSFYKLNGDKPKSSKMSLSKLKSYKLSDIEIPPPLKQDTKAYGQWTSSKFVGSVLNYLKSINFNNLEKKVPPTIPAIKISDTYPYASDFRVKKLRPPFLFQRRNFGDKLFNARRRDSPQINMKLLTSDLRNDILKSHVVTRPRNVEVTNTGEVSRNKNYRHYRNVDDVMKSTDDAHIIGMFKPRPFEAGSKNHKYQPRFDLHKNNNLVSILPFLKSVEYFLENMETGTENILNNNDMYTKNLSNGNKWHNVQSYSNDYTPRKIKMKLEDDQSHINILEANKKHPSINLKYKYENHKLVENKDDERIVQGRELATEVSNQSKNNENSISILKYNYGSLPGHEERTKTPNKMESILKTTKKHNKFHNNFNKQVKIGNALNERNVLGFEEEQKKKSFIGGDERIADINKYSPNIDNENENVPNSLGPQICKNVELYDRVLYVQPDGSIDITHILSSFREKNLGVEFVLQNYKKCSLEESPLENNNMLFIHWNKTPVRLFGGALPKKTTDLCGFF